MSNHEFEHHGHGAKIEAGQITKPECFPTPNELVCIQVPKVFDQVALRDCVTHTVTLHPGKNVCEPMFSFEGVTNFDIADIRVVSKSDSLGRAGFKKLKLAVKVKYTINYSDGVNELKQNDEVVFNLTVNEIYCPGCMAQIGVVRYPKEHHGHSGMVDEDGVFIKVEALIESLNDVLSPCTGVLALDLGGFFIVKCECIVQLLMPAYGYCPVPPEQQNPAQQSCKTFNDRTKTPFPTKFFPDQKWNPLDR